MAMTPEEYFRGLDEEDPRVTELRKRGDEEAKRARERRESSFGVPLGDESSNVAEIVRAEWEAAGWSATISSGGGWNERFISVKPRS